MRNVLDTIAWLVCLPYWFCVWLLMAIFHGDDLD